MQSINQQIWNLINGDAAIQKGLKRDVINIRGLAKFFIKKNNVKASLDSVISAIRRYESSEDFEEIDNISSVFENCIISTKNNIACITLRQASIVKLHQMLEMQRNHHISKTRFISGTNTIKLMTDNVHKDTVLSVFDRKNVLNVEDDLSEISITLSKNAISKHGVLAKLANEIALNNVNIVELLITPPDFLIYIKEKDIVRAHETLLRLSEG